VEKEKQTVITQYFEWKRGTLWWRTQSVLPHSWESSNLASPLTMRRIGIILIPEPGLFSSARSPGSSVGSECAHISYLELCIHNYLTNLCWALLQ
jgi:hypothetical protein